MKFWWSFYKILSFWRCGVWICCIGLSLFNKLYTYVSKANWPTACFHSHRRHGVSNHRQLGCLIKSLFKQTTKKHKISALLILWLRDSPHTGLIIQKPFLCHGFIKSCSRTTNSVGQHRIVASSCPLSPIARILTEGGNSRQLPTIASHGTRKT